MGLHTGDSCTAMVTLVMCISPHARRERRPARRRTVGTTARTLCCAVSLPHWLWLPLWGDGGLCPLPPAPEVAGAQCNVLSRRGGRRWPRCQAVTAWCQERRPGKGQTLCAPPALQRAVTRVRRPSEDDEACGGGDRRRGTLERREGPPSVLPCSLPCWHLTAGCLPPAVRLEVLRHQPVAHGPALHMAVLRAHGHRAHVQVPPSPPPRLAARRFPSVLKPHFWLFIILIDFFVCFFFFEMYVFFKKGFCVWFISVLSLLFVS